MTELPNSTPKAQQSLYRVTSSSAFLSQMTMENPMSFTGESMSPNIVRRAWSKPSLVPRNSSLRAGNPSSEMRNMTFGKRCAMDRIRSVKKPFVEISTRRALR